MNIFYACLCIASIMSNHVIAHDGAAIHYLNQIHTWADVLNIEGGLVAHALNPDQKWFNIATVLDRPYLDGVEFTFMETHKKFDLKETAIECYNELQNFFVHSTLIKYCIDNAHQISNKKNSESVDIIVQVHRPKAGIKYIKILHDILCTAYPEFCNFKKIDGQFPHEPFSLELPNNTIIHFRYGNIFTHYEAADIIISISLVAGFNINFKSGDMVIPTCFIPMNLDTMILNESQKYYVKNYFLENLQQIVDAQDTHLLNVINNKFTSPNHTKSALKATRFTSHNFNEVIDVQVNKNFSPSLLPKNFSIT